MAKYAAPFVIDAALDQIALCDRQSICSGQPASFSGIAAVQLGVVTMTPVTDYTKSAGTVSGRKITVAAKPGAAITTSGTATHLALWLSTDSTLRFVTTIVSQPVVAGVGANVPAWADTISAPS